MASGREVPTFTGFCEGDDRHRTGVKRLAGSFATRANPSVLYTQTSATLKANVNPTGGKSANASSNTAPPTPTGQARRARRHPDPGPAPVSVSASLTGLTANTAPASAAARPASCAPRPRACRDALAIENLALGPGADFAVMAAVAAEYEAAAELGGGDHVVVAAGHFAAPASWWACWPRARRLVRSGTDGADLALIEVIETETPSARFDRVVLGSGDGIFAEPAARLQADGCGLTVVCRRGSLSRQLQLAAGAVRLLEPEPKAAQGLEALKVA